PDAPGAAHVAPDAAPDAPVALIDAALAGIPDAQPPMPANLGDGAAPPAAIRVQPKHTDTSTRFGRLRVIGLPILTVTVDGDPVADSPCILELPVGRHRVRLQNLQNHLDELLPGVLIRENELTTIDRMPR